MSTCGLTPDMDYYHDSCICTSLVYVRVYMLDMDVVVICKWLETLKYYHKSSILNLIRYKYFFTVSKGLN